jgi:hypothetical protein
MSKIEEAIEEIMDRHLSGMDFSDMITTEVRECWDMDDLDRIDDIDDRLETVESWITDSEDKVSPQTIINLEKSIKNLCENVNDLKLRLVELEEQASKSFFQKLMFWR